MEGEIARQRGFEVGRDIRGHIRDCPYDGGKPKLIEEWVLGFGQGRQSYVEEGLPLHWPQGVAKRNGTRRFGWPD